MNGVWFWPSGAKEQEKVLRKILASGPILAALTSLSKSKTSLSNAQLDNAISSFSQWNTRGTIEQLLSLGFAEYKVELFGDAGTYALTELGKDVMRRLTGQPPQPAVVQPPIAKPAA